MAALVLLAILSFVVAPAIDVITQSFRSGGADNTVVVTWNGGRLTRSEVDVALRKQNQFIGFLHALGEKVLENGGQPQVPGFSQSSDGKIRSLGLFDEGLSAERVCIGRILTSQAERMGIKFDDKAADQFLLSFLDGKVSDEEFFELLRNHTDGLTMYDVREQLKQELNVMLVQSVAAGNSITSPPGKTWRDFLKLNQTARIEAYPVYVSEFVSKVSDQPSEREIQDIYEKGKNRPADLYAEEPGFLQMPQANIEFVETRFQDWVDREKAKLTEEEIRAEYDRKVELKLLEISIDDDLEENTATEETSQEGGATETTEPSSAEGSDSSTPESPETTSESAPAEPAPAEQPASAEQPAATEEPSAPAAEDQGSNSTRGKVRFVALQEESPATGEGASEAQEQPNPSQPDSPELPSEPASESVDPQSAEESAGDPPAEETPVDTADGSNSEASETAPSETKDTAQAADPVETETTAESTDSAETNESEPPKTRTQTFEEARDEIALELARTRVGSAVGPVISQLQQIMLEYYSQYRQYQAFKSATVDGVDVRDVEAPVRPDLRKFAEENGLIYGETGLGDSGKLASGQFEKFGKSSVYINNRPEGLVANVIPSPQIESFYPLQSVSSGPDADGFSQYLFWKTDGRPPRVPELSEAREQVVGAWKRNQAKALAEKAAQELAEKIRSTGGDDPWSVLPETLRTLVATTEPFTWLSRMGMSISPTFVQNLDGAGNDLMRGVFSTEVGEFGVAPNEGKSIFYVFRVLEKAPDTEELKARFEADQTKFGPAQVANIDQYQAVQNWRERIFNELNVKFEG